MLICFLCREATEIIEQPDPKRARVGLQNRTSSFADTLKTMEKEHPGTPSSFAYEQDSLSLIFRCRLDPA